jgi:formylglycine-generating enzyme required for sulfatase activity
MKKIFALLSFTVFFVIAFTLINLSTPASIPVQASPPESIQSQENIPDINGMVYIPPGEFIMGSTEADILVSADFDEFPQRRVFVEGFYIDIAEVTNVQYKLFVDSMHVEPPFYWDEGNYPLGMDGYPVSSVSWDDARAYAEFVGKRLPTEEEWEKAARGTDGRRYPWGNEFDNKKCNNTTRILPVWSLPEGASPYGILNMSGNVAEWVDGPYAPYPRSDTDTLHWRTAEYKPNFDVKFRVYRGGSWNSYGKYLRCANRENAKPRETWNTIGFRCAMNPPRKK